MKKKYQVFISSTYTDLITERAAAIQCLLDNDCIPVGMEQFPASDMSQMEYIRRMLDDCDYYILILGGRYGSLDQDGIGFTEKEYDYAISKRIPVMSFVFQNPDDLPARCCETSEIMKEKFAKFREKVCKDRLVRFHTDIGTLRANIATSINRCMRDYPAIGWTRGGNGLIPKDLTVHSATIGLTATTRTYACEGNFGSFTFDYSSNDGRFSIGKGEYLFTTRWSKASDTSVHAYRDGNIESIARVKGLTGLQSVLTGEYDFTSRTRTPVIGDVIIWKNKFGNYAATRVVSIKDDTRGADVDEITCEYVIYQENELFIERQLSRI